MPLLPFNDGTLKSLQNSDSSLTVIVEVAEDVGEVLLSFGFVHYLRESVVTEMLVVQDSLVLKPFKCSRDQ